MALDGTDFIAISDNGITPSTGTNQPVSALLERRLNANNKFLAQMPSTTRVAMTPVNVSKTNGVSERPWCSIKPGVTMLISRVSVPSGAESATFRACASVRASGGSPGTGDVTLGIKMSDGVSAYATTDISNTYSAGTVFSSISAELTFEAQPYERDCTLAVYVISEDSAARATTAEAGVNGNMIIVSDTSSTGYFATDPSSTNQPYDSDLMEVQYIVSSDLTNDGDADHEVLWEQTDMWNYSPYNSAHTFTSTAYGYPKFLGNQLVDVTRRYMSYIQCKAACIEWGYSVDLAIDSPQDLEMRGNIVLRAEPISKIAAAVNDLYDRPITHVIGPRPYYDTSIEDFGLYQIRWPFASYDSDQLTIIDESVIFTKDEPTLDIRFGLLPVVPRVEETDEDSITLTIAVEVDFLDDTAGAADWSTDTTQSLSSSTSKTYALYPAHHMSEVPIFSGVGIMEAKGSSYSPEFYFKEGSLFPVDVKYVQYDRIVVSLPSALGAYKGRPARVRVYADTFDASDISNKSLSGPKYLRTMVFCLSSSLCER